MPFHHSKWHFRINIILDQIRNVKFLLGSILKLHWSGLMNSHHLVFCALIHLVSLPGFPVVPIYFVYFPCCLSSLSCWALLFTYLWNKCTIYATSEVNLNGIKSVTPRYLHLFMDQRNCCIQIEFANFIYPFSIKTCFNHRLFIQECLCFLDRSFYPGITLGWFLVCTDLELTESKILFSLVL